MQLQGYEDRHFSLDQEAYVDELVRAYQLNDTHRSKIVCPKEILMRESEVIQPFDEQAIKAAQKVAGECLWLSQRTRIDIAFSTTVLCSKVSRDPHGAIEIGRRIIHYLHHTKDFKLHLKPVKGVAPLRVFTDASFAPLGQHSYGGHVVEVKGVPALWKASKQQLISLSSSEAELIQAVEGCMYAESLMTCWCLAKSQRANSRPLGCGHVEMLMMLLSDLAQERICDMVQNCRAQMTRPKNIHENAVQAPSKLKADILVKLRRVDIKVFLGVNSQKQ